MPSIPTLIKNASLVQKRRTQIIESAIKLFAKKGYHRATLKELAEEACISYGNIYDYVGKKEDIFFLIHEFINKTAMEILNQSIKDVKDPLEKLKRLIRAEIDILYQWDDAILLLYRETHLLMNNREYLYKILERERGHHEIFENVLKECIEKGYVGGFNIRLSANLIKIMCEACVLKRWDFKKHITQSEHESQIIKLILNGLFQEKASPRRVTEEFETAGERTALLINSETLIGKEILSLLLQKNLKLAVYNKNLLKDKNFSISHITDSKRIKYYSYEDYSEAPNKFFEQIMNDFGSIDIVIQDIGTGLNPNHRNNDLVGQILEENLNWAQNLAKTLEAVMIKRGYGRILYLAPWACDSDSDPIKYQIVKAGTEILTKTMAKRMAASNINVNCIVPRFIEDVVPLRKKSDEDSESIERIQMTYEIKIADILDVVYFLISENSKCLTGQVLELVGDLG